MHAWITVTFIYFMLAVDAIITVLTITRVAVDTIYARWCVYTWVYGTVVKVFLTVMTGVSWYAWALVAWWVILAYTWMLAWITYAIIDRFLTMGTSEAIRTEARIGSNTVNAGTTIRTGTVVQKIKTFIENAISMLLNSKRVWKVTGIRA